MSCKTPTFEELMQAVKNRTFLKIAKEKTQDGIVEALKFTSDVLQLRQQNVNPKNVGDDTSRYTLIDPSAGDTSVFLSNRVTDRVARYYRKIFEKPANANFTQMNYGTSVHKSMQNLLLAHYEQMMNNVPVDINAIYAVQAGDQYALSLEMVKELSKYAAKLLKDIDAMQKAIDPKGTFRIAVENVVVDPVKDLAGTVDLVVIFSDGTGGVLDFKTMSPKSNVIERNMFGNIVNVTGRDFVAATTRTGWSMQMNSYRDTLLEYYGLKDVRFTRVIPMFMNYILDENKQIIGLREIITEANFEQLSPRSVGVEKFTNAAINEFLKTRYEYIEQLNQQIQSASRLERPKLYQQLNQVYDSIDMFVNNMDITMLVNDARIVSEGTYETLSELRDAYTFVKAIVDLQRNLTDTVDDFDITFDEGVIDTLAKRAAVLHEKYIKLILDGVEGKYGKLNVEGGEILLSEDDLLTQIFSTTTESQNPIVRYAQDLFQGSYNDQRRDLRDFDEALAKVEKPLLEWAKSRGETLADVYKYLLDVENGKFYGRVDPAFIARANQERDAENVEFFTKNYEIKDKNAKGETYKEWYNRNIKELTQVLEARFKNLDENQRVTAIQRALDNWQSNNDLKLVNGIPQFPNAWLNKHNSWLKIKPGVLAANQSEQYTFMKANKPLLDYYEFLRDSVAKWRGETSYKLIDSYLFYPMVRASTIEKLGRTNAYGTLLKDIKEVLEIKQDDQLFGVSEVNDDGTVVEAKQIPLYFTQPFRNAAGGIDTSQMSTDISASFRLMAKSVYNYKYMNQIEADILALQDVLKMVNYEEGGWGKKVVDFMNSVAKKDKTESGSMTDTVFKALRDYHLYGIRLQPGFNPKFVKAVDSAMQWFTLRSLGLGIIPATTSYVAGQVSARLEAVKGQIWDTEKWNLATKLMAKESKKYHGIGFFFGVHNEDMLQDILRQRVGGVSSVLGNTLYNNNLNKYVDQRLLMAPWSYGQERLDNHIAVAMAHSYGFDSNGNVRLLTNLPQENQKSVYERMIFDEAKGSFTIEGLNEEQTSRAILQFQQAVRAGQKRVTGTLSQEDIAYWQTTLTGRLFMQFKSWMPSILKERFGATRFNDILDVVEQGRYRAVWENNEIEDNTNTFVYLLHTTKNTAAFIVKNLLMTNSIARRFGAKVKLDDTKLRKQYAAFLKKYEKYPGMLEKIPTFESFVQMKEGQIRAAIGELEVLILLSAAIFLLGSDFDDDGEPLWSETWVAHQIFKVLNRTKTELSFTYNAMEYAKLVANPIPITGLLMHVIKLLGNTLDETRDTMFGENNQRDKANKLHYSTGLVQGVYQLRKFFDILSVDEAATR